MISIIVESEADENFLRQFIQYLGLSGLYAELPFLHLKGKTIEKFKALETTHLTRMGQHGISFLAVLDADNDWEGRKKETLAFLARFGVTAERVFTFPDNSHEGNLETLLLDIIPTEKKDVIGCLNSAAECVAEKGLLGMDHKDVVYQYVCSHLDREQRKQRNRFAPESKRDYTDPLIWNLDSDALQPLKAFLKTHLSPL